MGTNQLELFDQEKIEAGINHLGSVLFFEFEGKFAWSSMWKIDSVRCIFHGGGGMNFDDIALVNRHHVFPSIAIMCLEGTWEKLTQVEHFRLVPNFSHVPLFTPGQ